jgi:Tfp pilus assembly protein PilW
MTLVEMTVSVVIGAIIMGAALALVIFSAKTYSSIADYDDLNRKGRNALDLISQDVRQSQHLSSYVSNSTSQVITFTNMPGSTPTYFNYTYSQGNLTRNWGTQSSVLISNIISLSFSFYQRNPSNNYTFIPTTDPTLAKLISVSWICTKPGFGSAPGDTEDFQEAKVVVRN